MKRPRRQDGNYIKAFAIQHFNTLTLYQTGLARTPSTANASSTICRYLIKQVPFFHRNNITGIKEKNFTLKGLGVFFCINTLQQAKKKTYIDS